MQLALLAVGFLAVIAFAYRAYGSWVSRLVGLDDAVATPAHTQNDGVDFVPTPRFYLFGQHFSAIAAAGPIAGPIIACQAYGWVPCLLWIGIGVVLIGAMHDFMALAASVRHGARSIADITRDHLGDRAGVAMMGFIWLALVYVIVAFADITSSSFVTGGEELAGVGAAAFHPGGAVAAASVFYLLLAVLMGIVQRFLNPPLWLLTVIFVPATFVMVWMGTKFSTLFILSAKQWALLILAYCCVASMAPVWALLQPRGYLGGFVLYLALALGVIGVFFGGYEIKQAAFKGFDSKSAGLLFPFLFVTIACGACSGFHGLVCSGTTSKQIDKESHIKAVGYGGMLAEAFVALIAMVTVMIVAQKDLAGLKPGTIYGNGIGEFMTLLIGEKYRNYAITFGAMAFSTFVFDTVDVSTRLGRYIVQELFRWPSRTGAWAGTILTIALPMYFVAFSPAGSWVRFWTLFGASNQLLAALTLLAITVWLHQRRQRIAFTLLPMLFVLVTTLYALVQLTISNFAGERHDPVAMVNGVTSASLIALALYLVMRAIVRVRADRAVVVGR
jgi:carbon starvation protein